MRLQSKHTIEFVIFTHSEIAR